MAIRTQPGMRASVPPQAPGGLGQLYATPSSGTIPAASFDRNVSPLVVRPGASGGAPPQAATASAQTMQPQTPLGVTTRRSDGTMYGTDGVARSSPNGVLTSIDRDVHGNHINFDRIIDPSTAADIANLGTIANQGGQFALNQAAQTGAIGQQVSNQLGNLAGQFLGQAGSMGPGQINVAGGGSAAQNAMLGQTNALGAANATASQLAAVNGMNAAGGVNAAAQQIGGMNIAGGVNAMANQIAGANLTGNINAVQNSIGAMNPAGASQQMMSSIMGGPAANAAVQSQLGRTQGANLGGGVAAMGNAIMGGPQANQATNSVLQGVQRADVGGDIQSALGRVRGFDASGGPSIAEAQLRQQAQSDFSNALSLARSGGGTAAGRAWAERQANEQNFARQAQTNQAAATLRAQEADMATGRNLQAMGLEGQLAAQSANAQLGQLGLAGQLAGQSGQLQLGQQGLGLNAALGAGQLQATQLGLESQLAQSAGQLQLGQQGLGLQAANQVGQMQLGQAGLQGQLALGAGNLQLGQLQAAGQLAGQAGQLQLGQAGLVGQLAGQAGQLQLGQAGLAGQLAGQQGQLMLGQQGMANQLAGNIDANALQAGISQAGIDLQSAALAQQGMLSSQQMGLQALGQSGTMALGANAQATNQGLLGYQMPYQAQMDMLGQRQAELDRFLQELNSARGMAAQRAQISQQDRALPWQVAGSTVAGGTAVLGLLSDKRAKRDVRRVDSELADEVASVGARSWRYKGGLGQDTETEFAGQMAQDLERGKLTRSAVRTGPDGWKRVDGGRLAALSFGAAGEALRRIKQLEARL